MLFNIFGIRICRRFLSLNYQLLGCNLATYSFFEYINNYPKKALENYVDEKESKPKQYLAK